MRDCYRRLGAQVEVGECLVPLVMTQCPAPSGRAGKRVEVAFIGTVSGRFMFLFFCVFLFFFAFFFLGGLLLRFRCLSVCCLFVFCLWAATSHQGL